jgi:nitric oxide dioxygenase
MAINTDLIKASAQLIAPLGSKVTEYFYNTMFTDHPEVRKMFPAEMGVQAQRLFDSIVYITSNIDKPDALVPYLQRLGSGHIKFDTRPEHYPIVGNSLMKTLSHFAGPAWTKEMAESWSEAYNLAASVMIEAAAKSMDPARYTPISAK